MTKGDPRISAPMRQGLRTGSNKGAVPTQPLHAGATLLYPPRCVTPGALRDISVASDDETKTQFLEQKAS